VKPYLYIASVVLVAAVAIAQQIGQGILIVPGNPPQIQLSQQAYIPIQVFNVSLVKMPNGTYKVSEIVIGIPEPRNFRLYRNGLRQKQGLDYTVDSSLTVTALFPWALDDILIADYAR